MQTSKILKINTKAQENLDETMVVVTTQTNKKRSDCNIKFWKGNIDGTIKASESRNKSLRGSGGSGSRVMQEVAMARKTKKKRKKRK